MIIKYWKEVFSTFIVPKFYGGGGGGQTSTSSVYQRNIPKELAPYYNVLLNAASKQAFTTKSSPNPNPRVDIKPYQSWYRGDSQNLPNRYDPSKAEPTKMANGGEVKRFAAGDLVSQIEDVTGIQPYRPYGMVDSTDAEGNVTSSPDVDMYVAGLSPLQQGAIDSAANLGTPSQFGTATKMATAAGMGGLDTAGKALDYGQQGNAAGVNAANLGLNAADVANANASTFGSGALGYGQQGVEAGINAGNIGTNAANVAAQNASTFGNQALTYGQAGSDAGSQYGKDVLGDKVKNYMNPYLDQSLKPQLALMNQQNDIANQKANSQAAQASAYGGSRQMVANSLNDQSNRLAQANLIGQGYNTAFDTANKNMQNAANLELQGAQTGLQGVNTGLSAGQYGLQGAQTGIQGQQAAMQGAQTGLSGVNTGISAGQYGLQGTQAGIQGQSTAIQGANTGLQGVSGAQSGYGLANSTASNLAGIGTSELGANQSIIGTQNQLGQQQQQLEQEKMNAMKNVWETQQNQPWQVLGQYANMLNGVPTTNVDVRTANPNAFSQALGTGVALAGAAAPYVTKKKGGVIKKPKVKAQGSGIGDLAVYNAMKGGK